MIKEIILFLAEEFTIEGAVWMLVMLSAVVAFVFSINEIYS